ncbi:MAG: Recombinase, partial [Candidatus Amesbacteria bacterium GW2011_GWA2_42_12]
YLLDTGKLLDLKFPSFWFENSPQGKFVLNMAFGQSKYYVDNLSENVKRGLRQQLRNGVWPAKSPYGYIYNKPGKKHEIDLTKSKLIKKIFQKYADSEWSQTKIANVLFENSYQRKNGKPLSLNEVVHLLTNKFYIGTFKYNNEWHEATHEKFISKNLFDDVQRRLKENKKQFRNLKFSFLGLVKCGECGASITAERKFKFYKRTRGQVEYIYYRCTKKIKPCSQKYIQEYVLEQQLRKIISDASLPEAWAENWNKWLDRDEIIERQQTSQRITETESETKKLDEKLNILLDGYLDGTIESSIYKNKKNELFARAKNEYHDLVIMAKNTGSDYFLTNRQLGVRYKMGFAELASRGDSLSERLRGIGPLSSPWQGEILPLNHSRLGVTLSVTITTLSVVPWVGLEPT